MSWLKDFLLLTVAITILFGTTLGHYPLAAPDGARYAEIPREMVVSGDYITPHLNGVKYFEKPPLFYWIQAASIKVFGVNDIAVSLVNALMALGCCLLVYVTGRKLYDRLSGIVSSFIFATSGLVFALTRMVTLDVALTFFLTGCLSSFIIATKMPICGKRSLYLWMMYIFAALAVMTKGLVGMLFPGAIILLWTILFAEWRSLKTYHLVGGTLIFLLIALPWHILVQIKNPEFFRFYFFEQHFLRYLTNYSGRLKQWWFYPVSLFDGLYPWVVFLPQALFHHLPKHFKGWQQYKPTIFLLLWATVVYVFYSFSQSKLIPYILPIFSPLAILIGNYFATYWHSKHHRSINIGFNLIFILNLLLGIGLIIAIFALNFNEQAITKQMVAITACCLFVIATISLIVYRRCGLSSGFLTLMIITAMLWAYLSPIITIVNKQSIKPLITALQQQLKPEDEVIAYGAYYQELPFYLQRRITVVNYTNELTFGMQHQDTKAWMIDDQNFWEHWNSAKRVYLITYIDYYNTLKTKATNNMQILAKYLNNVLVVNTKK